MKQWIARSLGVCLVMVLCGCGCKSKTPEEIVQEQCIAFVENLIQGDTQAMAAYLPEGDAMTQMLKEESEEGILWQVMQRLQYEVMETETQEDGSVLVRLQMETIDMKALLESLPEGISSMQEARQAMIDRAPHAARNTYWAELRFVPVGDQYECIYGEEFVNAVTGGLYDFFIEQMKEALEQ